MIDRNNDRNMLGRVIALAVILGAVYGVRAISRGGLGCPLGAGSSCCMMSTHHEEGAEKAEPVEKEEPAETAKPAAKPAPPKAEKGERPAPAEPVTDQNDD